MSPEIEEFVENEIANGAFLDRGELIEHALRLMKRDRDEAILGILAGLDDVAAGKMQPLDEAIDIYVSPRAAEQRANKLDST